MFETSLFYLKILFWLYSLSVFIIVVSLTCTCITLLCSCFRRQSLSIIASFDHLRFSVPLSLSIFEPSLAIFELLPLAISILFLSRFSTLNSFCSLHIFPSTSHISINYTKMQHFTVLCNIKYLTIFSSRQPALVVITRKSIPASVLAKIATKKKFNKMINGKING
jgi:hypothetical protein